MKMPRGLEETQNRNFQKRQRFCPDNGAKKSIFSLVYILSQKEITKKILSSLQFPEIQKCKLLSKSVKDEVSAYSIEEICILKKPKGHLPKKITDEEYLKEVERVIRRNPTIKCLTLNRTKIRKPLLEFLSFLSSYLPNLKGIEMQLEENVESSSHVARAEEYEEGFVWNEIIESFPRLEHVAIPYGLPYECPNAVTKLVLSCENLHHLDISCADACILPSQTLPIIYQNAVNLTFLDISHQTAFLPHDVVIACWELARLQTLIAKGDVLFWCGSVDTFQWTLGMESIFWIVTTLRPLNGQADLEVDCHRYLIGPNHNIKPGGNLFERSEHSVWLAPSSEVLDDCWEGIHAFFSEEDDCNKTKQLMAALKHQSLQQLEQFVCQKDSAAVETLSFLRDMLKKCNSLDEGKYACMQNLENAFLPKYRPSNFSLVSVSVQNAISNESDESMNRFETEEIETG